MNVRYAKKEDARQTAQVNVDGWKTAYKGIINDEFLNSLDYKEVQKRHESRIEKRNFCVCENENKEILGFCSFDEADYLDSQGCREYDCELIAIYVKPDSKGQGIGKKMFRFVLDEFRKQKKTKMILWVLEDNKPSIGFYEKMGGERIDKIARQIGNETYNELGFGYEL